MDTSTLKNSDSVEQNNDDECRFNFSEFTLPSLEEMASFQVVLPIWRIYLDRMKTKICEETRSNSSGKHFDSDDCLRKCDHSITFLKLPASIEHSLKKKLKNICEETNQWMHYFKYNLISIHLSCYHIENLHPDSCIWLQNGKIDYHSSVPKMLTDPGLSQVHRFAIMCEYCLEDEINKFSLIRLPEHFVEMVAFDTDYLPYYWIRYLRNEVHEIPLKGYSCVDFLMAATCNNERWNAFEYFFNRLGTSDQVSVAVLRFESPRAYSTQNRLLCKMSCFQRRRLLARIPDKIIVNFLLRLNSPNSALRAWNHCKGVIGAEQFVNLVATIFRCCLHDEEGMRVLIEIWNTAPDDLKSIAAEMPEDEIRPYLHSSSPDFPSITYQFLNLFLLAKTPESRRSFVLNNAGGLASHFIDTDSMNDILLSSLPLLDDRFRYRRKVLNSPTMEMTCSKLIEDENFDILNCKLDFHSTDVENTREYKKKLLISSSFDRSVFIFNFSKWNELCDFIDLSFADDESVLEVKKEFIFKYIRDCGNIKLFGDINSLDVMASIAERVFSIDELATIKKMLFDSFESVIADPNYWLLLNVESFQKFLSWCVEGDEEALLKFKKTTFNIDHVFNCIFKEMYEDYQSDGQFDEKLLSKADEWLNWYFGCVEMSRKFKMNKLHCYDEDRSKNLNILQLIREKRDLVRLRILSDWTGFEVFEK